MSRVVRRNEKIRLLFPQLRQLLVGVGPNGISILVLVDVFLVFVLSMLYLTFIS